MLAEILVRYSAIASSRFPCTFKAKVKSKWVTWESGLMKTTARGDRRCVKHGLGLINSARIFEHLTHVGEVPRILRSQARQILEYGDCLGRLTLLFQGLRQCMGRLRPERPRRHVVPKRLFPPRQPRRALRHIIIQPDVSWIHPLTLAQRGLGPGRISRVEQVPSEELDTHRGKFLDPCRLAQVFQSSQSVLALGSLEQLTERVAPGVAFTNRHDVMSGIG
jgi:hypothetical protein